MVEIDGIKLGVVVETDYSDANSNTFNTTHKQYLCEAAATVGSKLLK